MRRLALVMALLLLAAVQASAQEIDPPEGAKINSAQVSGFDVARLSPGLRDEIGKLAGTPLERARLKDLATRIEAEQPRYVAATRAISESDGGVRVVFVVARLRDQEHEGNVNARYVVEDVDIKGVADGDLSQAVRDAVMAQAGKPLDPDEAERLTAQLRDALPGYDISRRTVRGSQRGRIKVIYQADRAEWARWLHFEPIDASAVYHSDQGWGANLPLTISSRDVRILPIIAIDNGDDLIEEYSGFGIRFESRKIGTERLGAFFEWSTYDPTWRDSTLAAFALKPSAARLYRNRMNVTPLVKFALTPHVSIGGGVAITELDSLAEPGPSQMANAAVGLVRFVQRHPGSGTRQNIDAAFILHAGTRSLQSDLVYERYLGQARYSYGTSKQQLVVTGMAGRINGDAPMFERFSLGDSQTLRGWNKYDIAPAGGDRLFAASFEYRFHDLGLFLDSGDFWNQGTTTRVRFSSGVSYTPGPMFFTLGFPLNTDTFHAVFTMGFRFASLGWGRY